MQADDNIILNPGNLIHLGALHRTFTPIIQYLCDKYRAMVHTHKKKDRNGTPL